MTLRNLARGRAIVRRMIPNLQTGPKVALRNRRIETPTRVPLSASPDSFRLPLTTLPQPDETTCGPTCLHALYAYFGEREPLATVIDRMWRLEHGGTYAVFLGCDALRKG